MQKNDLIQVSVNIKKLLNIVDKSMINWYIYNCQLVICGRIWAISSVG